MPEKTVNAYQRFILLRSRCVVIAVCLALLLCPMALTASAARLDYNDYITNVTVDGDNDIVTVSLPVNDCFIRLYNSRNHVVLSEFYHNTLTYDFDSSINYLIDIYPIFPNDLLLTNIPDSTLFVLTLDNDITDLGYYDLGSLTASAIYYYYDPARSVEIPYSVFDLGNSTWAFELDKQGATHVSFSLLFFVGCFLVLV